MINLSLLMPEFQDKLKEFVLEANYQGHKVDVQSALRTLDDQSRLYALGRTVVNPDGSSPQKPLGNIVTNAKAGYSWHNWGVAADVVYLTQDGHFTWEVLDSRYLALSGIAKQFGLEWGGSWTRNGKALGDLDHFQLTRAMPVQMAVNLGNMQAVWEEIRRRI